MKMLAATILATALAVGPVLAETTPAAPAAVPVAHKTMKVAAVKKRSAHARRHAHKKAAPGANTETTTDSK